MAELIINGYAVPDDNLTQLDRTRSDITTSSSGRGETGKMNITYVRTGVRKYDITLTCVEGSIYAGIVGALETKPQNITVIEEDGTAKTFTVYNSDIKDVLRAKDASGKRYYDITLSLTEL